MGELDKDAYLVHAMWDAEVSVWVATSEDVPGLVVEADTMETLIEKLQVMIPELLELNGILPSAYEAVPFHLLSEADLKASVIQ